MWTQNTSASVGGRSVVSDRGLPPTGQGVACSNPKTPSPLDFKGAGWVVHEQPMGSAGLLQRHLSSRKAKHRTGWFAAATADARWQRSLGTRALGVCDAGAESLVAFSARWYFPGHHNIVLPP